MSNSHTSSPPTSVWIIQNMRGDYNDEYYTPRSTKKFFLSEDEAVAALVPYHRSVAAKSKIAKRINGSPNPNALWHELVKFIHFPVRFSEVERECLAAHLHITKDKLAQLRSWSNEFDNGLEEYRIFELRLDADVPCGNNYFVEDKLADLHCGTISQEEYDADVERHKQTWWKIEC